MSEEPEEESEYVMVDGSGNLVTEVHGEGAESDEDIDEEEEEEDDDEDDDDDDDSDDLSEEAESEEADMEPTLEELAGK
jgi:hypothetical protein